MKKIFLMVVFLFLTGAVQADYLSLPYTYTPKQLITAEKENANNAAMVNATKTGDKDFNIRELYINGTKTIDISRNGYFLNVQTTGNFTILGNQSVSGDLTIITGNLYLTTGNLSVQGDALVSGDLTVIGALNWSGKSSVTFNEVAIEPLVYVSPNWVNNLPTETVWYDPVYVIDRSYKVYDASGNYVETIDIPTFNRTTISGQEYIGFVSSTAAPSAIHFQAEIPEWAAENTPNLVIVYSVTGGATVLSTVSYTLTYNIVLENADINTYNTVLSGSWLPTGNANCRMKQRFALQNISSAFNASGNVEAALQVQFQRNTVDNFPNHVRVYNFGIEYYRRRL